MKTIIRGKLLNFTDQAEIENCISHLEFIEDGAMLLENGFIIGKGSYDQIYAMNPDAAIRDHSGCFILPGFIDAHVHSVQTASIASYGSELLEWLQSHIFPLENRFGDPEFAGKHLDFFLNQLISNGTTTAAVFSSVHSEATELLFQKAAKLNLRIISGKTLMDRNAPEYLIETAQNSFDPSVKLIQKWHNHNRLSYAVSPRFAITSSRDELEMAGFLKKQYPDIYIQTHLSENKNEVEEVLRLFPEVKSYLEVYAKFGLISEKSLLAHCIHLTEAEKQIMKDSGAVAVHCPAANLFLGSGLFDFNGMIKAGIKLAAGSDVGAGDSFSMFRVMNQAYKVSVLKGNPIPPAVMFYLITLGGAKALSMDRFIGNFSIGKEADFLVIDPSVIDLVQYRLGFCENISDVLFTLLMLGDERIVREVYIMGDLVKNPVTIG